MTTIVSLPDRRVQLDAALAGIAGKRIEDTHWYDLDEAGRLILVERPLCFLERIWECLVRLFTNKMARLDLAFTHITVLVEEYLRAETDPVRHAEFLHENTHALNELVRVAGRMRRAGSIVWNAPNQAFGDNSHFRRDVLLPAKLDETRRRADGSEYNPYQLTAHLSFSHDVAEHTAHFIGENGLGLVPQLPKLLLNDPRTCEVTTTQSSSQQIRAKIKMQQDHEDAGLKTHSMLVTIAGQGTVMSECYDCGLNLNKDGQVIEVQRQSLTERDVVFKNTCDVPVQINVKEFGNIVSAPLNLPPGGVGHVGAYFRNSRPETLKFSLAITTQTQPVALTLCSPALVYQCHVDADRKLTVTYQLRSLLQQQESEASHPAEEGKASHQG